MGKNLAKGENPAWASEQNGNDPDVLSSQPLEWYLEESTHSSRYFIGSYVLDNFLKVVQMFRQFYSTLIKVFYWLLCA
jgi:hypothetical protein